jgi:hypothetical protein
MVTREQEVKPEVSSRVRIDNAIRNLPFIDDFVGMHRDIATPGGERYMRLRDPVLTKEFDEILGHLRALSKSDLIALAKDDLSLREYALRFPSVAEILPGEVLDDYARLTFIINWQNDIFQSLLVTNNTFLERLSDAYFGLVVDYSVGLVASSLLRSKPVLKRLSEGQRESLSKASKKKGPIDPRTSPTTRKY